MAHQVSLQNSVGKRLSLIPITPNLGISGSVEDRVALLTATFKAFTIIGEAFGPEKKEEVRAVAVALYAGRLFAEVSMSSS